jgi:hypothetical protein
MRTTGSTKVVHDPWLVVGTADGYEAHRLQVTERHLFDRSRQAVQFAGDFKAES